LFQLSSFGATLRLPNHKALRDRALVAATNRSLGPCSASLFEYVIIPFETRAIETIYRSRRDQTT
jgi:hypothetical protein